jgi:hypothetical protein
MFGGIGVLWLIGLLIFFVAALAAVSDLSWRLLRGMGLKAAYGWPWLFRTACCIGMALGVVLWIAGRWLIH